MRRYGIFALIFLVLVLSPLVLAEDLEEEVKQQQVKLENLRKEQQRLEAELKRLLQSEKNLAQELEKLDQQIEVLEKDVVNSRNRILELEAERARLREEIEQVSKKIENNRGQVEKSMVRVYKYSVESHPWFSILDSADPAELSEKRYLWEKYHQFELETIEQHRKTQEQYQNKIKEIEKGIRLELVLKEKLLLEEQNLTQLKEARAQMLQKINSDVEQFRRKQQELVEAQKNLEGLIATLQEELKRRESAASREIASLPPVKKGKFFWPVQGGKVIRPFGEGKDPDYGVVVYNPGIDVAVSKGSPVFAAHDGVVLLARSIRGYGKTILLEHGQNTITMYAHLEEIRVEPGERVAGGQVIGTVGDSGLADQPMIHFEVRVGTSAREENPLSWLQ
ncbi:MAG: hypothetical protein PWP04_535 [Candidatus Atribacteria bacterium]|nr:hypothetical protein [Candidatus Atribacteria bacterium]